MFAYTKGNFQDKTNYIHLNRYFDKAVKYVLKRGSFGSKDQKTETRVYIFPVPD